MGRVGRDRVRIRISGEGGLTVTVAKRTPDPGK